MQGTPRGTSRLIPRVGTWNRHVQDTKPRAINGTAKYNTYRVKHVTSDVSKDNNAAIVRVETATDWLRRLWHCSPWKRRGIALNVTWLKISVCIKQLWGRSERARSLVCAAQTTSHVWLASRPSQLALYAEQDKGSSLSCYHVCWLLDTRHLIYRP